MITKLVILIGGATALAAALLWPGQPGRTPPAPASAPSQNFADLGPAPLRGLAIQLASGYRPVETYTPLLKEIVELGANTVLLSVAGFMEHATSQSIYLDMRKAPSAEDLKTIIRRGEEMGLNVILMPIVLLRNPRGSEWRGIIEPPDWEEWWNQYTDFVLWFADIAREAAADGLMVGSELISSEKQTARWVKLIQTVRPRFWCGKLGYSANWDHYRPIEFWDHLDFVGMTSYFTLADKKDPTVEEIVTHWEPIQKDILAWQRRIGRPILFTEVGWCSQEGAAMAPWNYYQNQKATPAGMEEQRRLYEAFIRVWGNTPELLGVIWWEWTTDPGGPDDYGYTPKGKPAEQVLRSWLPGAGGRNAAVPPTPAPQR